MDDKVLFELRLFRNVLRLHKENLTRQQLLTLKGLAKSGNITGAYKGLKKILERKAS